MLTIFRQVLSLSLSSSVVILAVILIRFLLTGLPKKWSYLLWSVAAFRLCCPVSLRSAVSVFSVAPTSFRLFHPVAGNRAVAVMPSAVEGMLSAQAPSVVPEPLRTGAGVDWMTLCAWIWVIGAAILLLVSLYRSLRLRSLLLDAVQAEPGVYETDRISAPFVFGLLQPRIYLPLGVEAERRRYVLAHERYHLRRGDHWVKALAFLILAVHWFNPLCWLAFYLMGRDMELSCDEHVLSGADAVRADYSAALLSFAAPRQFPMPGALTFGASDVSRRVKNALRWQRPKPWATILSLLLCVGALAACALNPRDEAEDLERQAIRDAAMQATALSTRQSQVVDANGSLLPGIVDAYEEQLRAVFTEDSGYIDQYVQIMRSIVDGFDDTTDVVASSDVIGFHVQKLKIDGDLATLVCKVTGLQRYIPHREDGGYDVIFAASKEKVTYTLVKGADGQWRVQSFDSEDYIFGTPLEMLIKGNYKEKSFPTREEACQYAASY